jgi:ADP-heptose:LPS heptosyltransferase
MAANRIIISRTDNMGDVVLTYPLCAWLRKKYPKAELIFLCKQYTKPIVQCFNVIDQIVCWEDVASLPSAEQVRVLNELNADIILHVFPRKEIASLAKKARIPMRIGTSHRVFHLLTCTHRLRFTRKKSLLHEAQLNFHLAEPLGCKSIPSWEEVQDLSEGFRIFESFFQIALPLSVQENAVLLHPGSRGSAVEWPLAAFVALALQLKEQGIPVYFTGTEEEGLVFRSAVPWQEGITDLSGKLNLEQLLVCISKTSGLVACSTGPLHLAGILGKKAIGLFSPRVPIHPGRWRPLGKRSNALVYDENCPTCKKGRACSCVNQIKPADVYQQLVMHA